MERDGYDRVICPNCGNKSILELHCEHCGYGLDVVRDSQRDRDADPASRTAVWKRQAWMFAALLLAGVVVTVSVLVSKRLGHPGYVGPLVISLALLDARLFSWGVDYFDLTIPWQFREATEPDTQEQESVAGGEYDGPRLGEMIKFSVLFGPEGGIGAWPAEDGAIYVTPETAYQYRGGDWIDLDADTEALFRSVATYVDPQEYRRRQRE